MTQPQYRTLCILLLAILAGCRQPNQLVVPPPPQVTVAQPVERPVSDTIEFVATTQATQSVDLRSQVKGYLEKILFEDGSNVKKGDLLFIIEQAPYKLALDSARAALQKTIANQSLAESQYRRMEPLLKNGVVTREELDVQAAQVATTKADVAAAETNVATAELNLSYTHIHAPISGRIGQHLVDIGNLVQAQETLLATIQSIDPIYAQFDLSESDLLRFMAMMRNKELPDPEENPPTLYLGLSNEQGFPHVGKLEYRDLKIDPSTGTARRRGIFPNPDWSLIPGMFVKVSASIGSPVPRLLVEERAIGTDQRGDYLLVVNDKDVVEYRTVRLGIHLGMFRVVEEGVTKDDWVVINGLQRARPGATVKPERTQMNVPAIIKVEQSGAAAATPAAPAETEPNAAPQPDVTKDTKDSPATNNKDTAPSQPSGEPKEEAASPPEKSGSAK